VLGADTGLYIELGSTRTLRGCATSFASRTNIELRSTRTLNLSYWLGWGKNHGVEPSPRQMVSPVGPQCPSPDEPPSTFLASFARLPGWIANPPLGGRYRRRASP